MRIEEIRFCNLNSLAGEWVVNFTDPAYAAEGLFAITGPTGAGKSTILDAICLALYGRTPRLAGISASSNEIMSRQTGECRAEVTFSSRHGRFRCSWHQKRARNRPDGALQPIERSFADAATGEVLEKGVKKVTAAVEASTGMDFDRFTRSVMLAQGGFAAFLFSEPEQRSRILESLTGTGIYRDISCHVHMRHSEEKRTLENLKSRLEGINLLSAEDEQRLCDELAGKRQQQTALTAEQAETEKRLTWLRGLEQIRTELTRLETQKTTLLEQHAAFEPQRRILRRAEKAQTLRPAFTELTLVSRVQAEAQQNLEVGVAAVPALERHVQEAEQRHASAESAAEATRKTHETALPALREAGKLDALLAEKAIRLQDEAKAFSVAEAAHTSLKHLHAGHQQELVVLRENLTALHLDMETHAADKVLVESLTGLEERFANVRRLHDQLQSGQKAESAALQAGVQAEKALAEQTAHLEALHKTEAEARTRLEAQQTVILDTLQGRELSAWREEHTSLLETKGRLLAAQDMLGRRQAVLSGLRELQTTARTVEARRQAREKTITAGEVRYAALAENLAGAEREASRLQVMASLAAHRAQLKDGSECPLCGAVHHPFAAGAVPVADNSVEALKAAKAACEQTRRELEALRIQQAEDNTALQENAARQKEQTALSADLSARLEDLSSELSGQLAPLFEKHSSSPLPELSLDLLQPEADQSVTDNLCRVESSIAAITTLLGKVEADEKLLPGLRTALQVASDKAAQGQMAQATSTQSLTASRLESARLNKANAELSESLQTLLRTLEAELLPFGESSLTLELLDRVLNRLRTRRERWQGFAARDIALQQSVAALDAQITQEGARLTNEVQQLQARRELLQTLTAERNSLHEQRLHHFSGDDPAKEEVRLAGLVASAEATRKSLESSLATSRQALAARQTDIARLQVEIAERGAQLQALQVAFGDTLRTVGFADQADFLDARLTDEAHASLAAEERRLDDARTGLEANRLRLTEQLALLQAEPLTASTLPELEAEQARLIEALRVLHSESGALEQTLKANADARLRHAELFTAITRQQEITSRWADLNALIGSADGKKYSKFAQGITFEIMLDHANRQLQAMRDRYLLVRDATQPLTLNVIDSYQGGEVRTTANLSGGESFLVSLALALGLSRMASQNVRVDSLFLDEGFGSLDDDALETALSTISSLREEGKLIGLISHVPTIKERISTQIVVTPVTGGRSRLEGAGVSSGAGI